MGMSAEEYKKLVRKSKKRGNPEHQLQVKLVNTIRVKYPGVLFTATCGGVFTSDSQRMKLVAAGYNNGVPDLIFFEPRGKYHGLNIELKVPGNTATSDQEIWNDLLLRRGYMASICTGWDEAWAVIEQYFKLPKPY